MGVIKPTISLTANARTAATDAGPLSVALSLSATDSITVTKVAEAGTAAVTTTHTGEFAWFPWFAASTGTATDIYLDHSASGTKDVEYWVFQV
jgi:hypothetical protein